MRKRQKKRLKTKKVICRDCNKIFKDNWYSKLCNKCKNKKYNYNHRKAFLKYVHGISEQDYNDLFNKQKGRCGICGEHQSKFRNSLHIDHVHKTDKIRGLLCMKCNTALGSFNDNPDILFNAIQYLRR